MFDKWNFMLYNSKEVRFFHLNPQIFAIIATLGGQEMKSTGMVRKIDELGRIVIPKEIRRTFGIQDNIDAMEIFIEKDTIILRKYSPTCSFCQQASNLKEFKGQNLCDECIAELAKLL